MLPLLNKLSAYISGAPGIRIGAALGRNGMRATVLRKYNGAWQIARVQEIPVPFSLFEGEPPSNAVQVLSQTLVSILPEAVKNFVPLHLALPGAAISLRVFALDAVPKVANDRLSLVRWRLAQELAVGHELAASYQVLEDGEQNGALLGIAMDARWLKCLTEACSVAQIVPAVIDAGYSYLFNHFHSGIAAFRVSTALICLEAESWSMLVIDEQARIRFARSWWRSPAPASAEDYQNIALEAEQSIRAYIHGGVTLIQRISIAGEGADIKSVAAILDQRMQQPCHTLAIAPGVAPDEHRGFSTAIAASFDNR